MCGGIGYQLAVGPENGEGLLGEFSSVRILRMEKVWMLLVQERRQWDVLVADFFYWAGFLADISPAFYFVLWSDMVEEGKALAEKPHIVISTPGRLADHISTGTNFSLKKLRFLVRIFSLHLYTVWQHDAISVSFSYVWGSARSTSRHKGRQRCSCFQWGCHSNWAFIRLLITNI